MKVIIYLTNFCLVFTLIIASVATFRYVAGYNSGIHLFANGSAAYIENHSCTIDMPKNKPIKEIVKAFNQCIELHTKTEEK
tara:strand:+ start:1218 stop:1460 length:243 start_codon:yes stop_codon:yes gene_type:complete